jgi:ligand-binding sensor domain-containing protein/AraC-like DNA-binding protein
MNHIKYCLITILLFLTLYSVDGMSNNDRPYFCRVKEFSSADGLTQEHIVDFVQDRHGFIWFGTWNGLVRYDGYLFHTFKPSQSLAMSNRIISMRLYKDGNIWCTTYDNRLHIFDTNKCMFTRTVDATKEEGWENRPGMIRMQRHSADIWFKDISGNTINWNNGGEPTCRISKSGLSFTLPIYDEQGATDYRPQIEDYAIDSQNNLWLIMSRKLARVTFYPYWFRHRSNGSNTETRALFIDRNGRLWTGCKDGTLRIWNKEMNICSFLSPNGHLNTIKSIFSKSNVYSICCDKYQRIWIGTKGDGLFCLTPLNHGMNSFSVRHFLHDNNDNRSLSDNEIYSITPDRSGHLWIGTWKNGVNIVNEHQGMITFTNSDNGLSGYPTNRNALKVRCMYCSSDGTIFIGTTDGLITYTNKTFHHTLASTDIMQIIAAQKRIYLCTYANGIIELMPTNLSSGSIKFNYYDAGNTVNNCYINAVYDGHSSIWLFSESSLMRFNILNHRYSVYDEENFGERYYFSEAKTVINHKGVITAGTENGIFYFNTASIRYGDKAPYITISGLQYQGENFIHPVNDINELTLTPQQRSLTIFLSTPNKSEMTKTSFAYILEGYDKKWNYIINGNAISYGNLPPGTYSLKICVSNAEGKWENNIRKITVVVKPMFTETVWFFILIALLVIVCISGIGYVTYYIKRLRARQSQLLEYIEQNMRKQENDKPSGTVTPQFTPPSMPDHDKEFLDKFTEIFLANICNSDMSIDDFATELGMSHAVFYRKIKQLVGVTPVDFIRRLRVKRAIQYFDVGERQIADVAYKTGFSDPKYFSRCFKSETGCSPSEYCQQKDETK